MKRVLTATVLLLPVFLIAGCGVDPTTALAVIGLLFIVGVVGSRDAATPVDSTPLGEAKIHVENGRGTATLHLKETSLKDVPAADVKVTGTASPDGTFDLSGKLPDGTAVRVAGKNGDLVRLTIGAKTTEHSSIRQSSN